MSHTVKKVAKSSALLSPTLKKLLMLCCLATILLISALAIFYTQSTSDQITLGSKQQGKVKINDKDPKEVSAHANKDKADRAKERIIAAQMEETANNKLKEILPQAFGTEQNVEGSVHYDLPILAEPADTEDPINPQSKNTENRGQSEETIQSSDFSSNPPVETYIQLIFQADKQIDELNLENISNLYDQLHEVGIVNIEQRSSFLLTGPKSARLFTHSGNSREASQLEEIAMR